MGRIPITGGASLVGRNPIPRFEARGFTDLAGFDQVAVILEEDHSAIDVIVTDSAADDGCQDRRAAVDARVHDRPISELGFAAKLPTAQRPTAGLPVAATGFPSFEVRRRPASVQLAEAMAARIPA